MPFWERSALPLATEGTQECIWNLSYNERRMAIELELTMYLEEEDADALICQFPVPADYDGAGLKGTKFATFIFDTSINHGKSDYVKYYMPDISALRPRAACTPGVHRLKFWA